MKFLVLSHTHSLLPFAYRLQLQGHDVRPVVAVQAFEAAWRGKIESSPRGAKGLLDPEWLKDVFTEALSSGTVVLTDDWRLQEKFQEINDSGDGLFGLFHRGHPPTEGLHGPLRIGGWFDGSQLISPHLLIVDRGAWPGGMGPAVDGALTLIRVDNPDTLNLVRELTVEPLAELAGERFQGLVQFDLDFKTEDGSPEVSGMEAGWPFLHTHAFVSELEDFADLLGGATLVPTDQILPRKFVTVLPLSRPPWPTRKAKFRFELAPIGGLTGEQMARVFWHDVQADQEAGTLSTAGLDGLIGVVRGAANTNELALLRALEVALRVQLPEKQFRSDAGRQVQSALAELEGRFDVLI